MTEITTRVDDTPAFKAVEMAARAYGEALDDGADQAVRLELGMRLARHLCRWRSRDAQVFRSPDGLTLADFELFGLMTGDHELPDGATGSTYEIPVQPLADRVFQLAETHPAASDLAEALGDDVELNLDLWGQALAIVAARGGAKP